MYPADSRSTRTRPDHTAPDHTAPDHTAPRRAAPDPGAADPTRRARHTADTRAALVAAARELFGRRGYADTGTEEIVALAGVTRGALYHHFRDKADLFTSVMTEVAGKVATELTEEVLARAGDGGSFDQLRDGFQAFLDATLDPEFQRIVLVDSLAVLGPQAWADQVERYGLALLRQWLADAMARGEIAPLPTGPLASLLTAVIAQASLDIARAGDHRSARREVGATLDRLLAGLQPHPPATPERR
ncbi:MAG: TetR/AcrR family transcriptional regulator [Acidimicrobiales bacterium]